jgi:ABC-2 type transport system permease protein
MFSLGLFTVFTNASDLVKTFLFTGVVGWSTVYFSQQSIGRSFLSEYWHRTFKQTFSSPINLKDFIIGHWLYGVLGSIIGFVSIAFATLLVFNFNLFSLGVYIPLTIGLAVLSGLIIGSIILSLILLLGFRVDFLVWSVVDIIIFISGTYYSVTVFPYQVQVISHLFPVIYVLEGMRGVLNNQTVLQTYLQGYFVAFIWLIMILILIKKMEIYAKKKGFYQRYG